MYPHLLCETECNVLNQRRPRTCASETNVEDCWHPCPVHDAIDSETHTFSIVLSICMRKAPLSLRLSYFDGLERDVPGLKVS